MKLADEGNRDELVPKLRIESRRKYLERREQDKLQLLKGEIKDEQRLFKDTELTEREKRQLEHKQTVLKYAEEYDRAKEIEQKRKYFMPTEDGKPGSNYIEVDDSEKQINSEQRRWEDERLNLAKISTGAKDKHLKHLKKQKDYDLLVGEEIDFIKALEEFDEKLLERKEKVDLVALHRRSIEECQKSLPVYSFKEDLVEQIKNHPVLIVTAETGNSFFYLLRSLNF